MTKKILLFALMLFLDNATAQCFTSVFAYERNVIARATDGTLWYRGTNQFGISGDGTTTPQQNFVQIGTDNNWTDSFYTDSSKVWALKTDGSIWRWGTIASNTIITPTPFVAGNDWIVFSAVNISFYGIKQDGTLWAWGRNINGRLGTGNLDNTFETNVPQQIGTATNWKKVISAPLHALALKTDGTIWSWGDSTGQFLGYVGGNLNNNFRSPKQVGTATDWDNIFASFYAKSFGMKTNGRLWSWGLGHPNAPGQLLPYAQLPIPFGVESWVMSSINGNQVFLLKTDGTRWGEGYNYWPQYLGTGPNTGGSSYSMVTQLDADTDWKYVHANQNNASGFAIKENGGLYFWGFGWFAGEGPFVSPTLIASPCTLSTETFEEQTKVSVAPNPAGNFTTLTFGNPTDEGISYWITNGLGQIVQAETTIPDKTKIVTIDTASYSLGVYYLCIKMNNQTKTLRFLKH